MSHRAKSALRIARKYAEGGAALFDPTPMNPPKTPNQRVLEGHQELESGYGHVWGGRDRLLINSRGQYLQTRKAASGGGVDPEPFEANYPEPEQEPLEANYPEPPPDPKLGQYVEKALGTMAKPPVVERPMEPDLTAVQTGSQELPEGYAVNDAGFIFNKQTGEEIKPERRPSILPFTKSGDPAMSKVLDVAGNLGGGWSVPKYGAEAILGAGLAVPKKLPKTMGELPVESAYGVGYHPKPNDEGMAVKIHNPTEPSPSSDWFGPGNPVTFVPGQKEVPKALYGVSMEPYTPPPSWENISGSGQNFKEPPLHPTSGKMSASGVIIREPDGRIWLTQPTNGFGGYETTFPKGKLEGNLTPQENAIKEAFEETGLKVKLTGWAGDFDKDTSTTRYYWAEREGGNPAQMGWETQGLKLVRPDDAFKLLNKPTDQAIYKKLWQGETKKVSKEDEIFDLNPERIKDWKKITGTLGTHSGGVYESPDGVKWYIKNTPTMDHAMNEKLAAELYKLLGVPIADTRITKLNGKPAIASKWIPGHELNQFHPSEYQNIADLHQHLPAHLLTENYDYIGTGKNNTLVTAGENGAKQAHFIDLGGAIRYRAQGAPKDWWNDKVKMFDLAKNKDMADVLNMQGYDPQIQKIIKQGQKESAARVGNIMDEQIDNMVNQWGPPTHDAKQKLKQELKSRRNQVAEMYGVKHPGMYEPSGPLPPPKSAGQYAEKFEVRRHDVPEGGKYALRDPYVDANQLLENHMYISQNVHDPKNYNSSGLANDIYKMAEANPKHAESVLDVIPADLKKDVEAKLARKVQREGDPWSAGEKWDVKDKETLMNLKKTHSPAMMVHSVMNHTPTQALLDKVITDKQISNITKNFGNADPKEVAKAVADLDPQQLQNLKHWLPTGYFKKLKLGEQKPKTGGIGHYASNDPRELADMLVQKNDFHAENIAKDMYYMANSKSPELVDQAFKALPPDLHADVNDSLTNFIKKKGYDPWEPEKGGEAPKYRLSDEELYQAKKGAEFAHEQALATGQPHTYELESKVLFSKQQALPDEAFHWLDIQGWQKYKPKLYDAYAEGHPPEKPVFKYKTAKQVEDLGFGVQFVLKRGEKSKFGATGENPYPSSFKATTDPTFKGYGGTEKGYYLADMERVAGEYANQDIFGGEYKALVGDYVYRPPTGRIAEVNFEQINHHRGYSSTQMARIIEASRARGADMVIVHHVSDMGHSNHTQYIVLRPEGLRSLRAKFAKEDLDLMQPHRSIGGVQVFRATEPQDKEEQKRATGGRTMPLKPGSSKAVVSQNISEFHGGKTYNATAAKFGKAKANKQAIAVALSNARKYAKGGISTIPKMPPKLPKPPKPGAENIQNLAMKGSAINLGRQGLLKSSIPGRTDKLPMNVKAGSYVLPADIPSALGQGNTMAGGDILKKMFTSGPYGMAPMTKRAGRGRTKAGGGEVDGDVPIIAAGGEYIIPPEAVQDVGHGNMQHGHDVLDKFVKRVRKHHIQTLKKLPGPKK